MLTGDESCCVSGAPETAENKINWKQTGPITISQKQRLYQYLARICLLYSEASPSRLEKYQPTPAGKARAETEQPGFKYTE